MSPFRAVTDAFSVSPQLDMADLRRAKEEGFQVVINNRPDGESPGQPASVDMERTAGEAGLAYLHIPVTGRPTPDQARAVAKMAAGRRTLAYCRSGTRSITAWALGQLAAGDVSREELLRLGAAAGYDLGGVLSVSAPPTGQ